MGSDETYLARNIFGVAFEARAREITDQGVRVEIEGIAHLSARSTILIEKDDPIPTGFLCR